MASATPTTSARSAAPTSASHPVPAPRGTTTPRYRPSTSPTAIGYVARRGGQPQEIRPGDVIYIEPGEEHWHGATPGRFMAHVAIQEADNQGEVVTWLEHVTDEEYTAAPAHD